MRDLANHLHFKPAIAPIAARTDNTAIVSEILDVRDFESVMLAIQLGANTDANATFTVLLEESNDSGMSGATAVAVVMLVISFLLLLVINALQAWQRRRSGAA